MPIRPSPNCPKDMIKLSSKNQRKDTPREESKLIKLALFEKLLTIDKIVIIIPITVVNIKEF
jgi:FMN-dependent NADH-azoreductase